MKISVLFLLIVFAVLVAARNKTDCTDPVNFELYDCGFCNSSIECHYPRGKCIDGRCDCRNRYANNFCQDKRKNWLTALITSMLFGGLGVDRFYLGYTGMGVGKLFLFFSLLISILLAVSFAYIFLGGGILLMDEQTFWSDVSGRVTFGFGVALIIISLLIGIASFIGFVVWYVMDILSIATGNLHEANGNALYFNGKIY